MWDLVGLNISGKVLKNLCGNEIRRIWRRAPCRYLFTTEMKQVGQYVHDMVATVKRYLALAQVRQPHNEIGKDAVEHDV